MNWSLCGRKIIRLYLPRHLVSVSSPSSSSSTTQKHFLLLIFIFSILILTFRCRLSTLSWSKLSDTHKTNPVSAARFSSRPHFQVLPTPPQNRHLKPPSSKCLFTSRPRSASTPRAAHTLTQPTLASAASLSAPAPPPRRLSIAARPLHPRLQILRPHRTRLSR